MSSNPHRTKYVDTSRLFLKLFKKRDNSCVDFVSVVSREAIKFYLWSDYLFYGGGKGSGPTVNLVLCIICIQYV